MSRFLSATVVVFMVLVSAAFGQDEPPPWADAFSNPTNFLACRGNPYALCYYSGPDTPTPRYNNVPAPSLPCTVQGDDTNKANCTCYAITEATVGPLGHNFVLIDSILNPEVRQETITQCGETGENCLNMTNLNSCQADRSQSQCQPAKVCSHLGNIRTGKKQTLYPKHNNVELISTFSFTYSFNHKFGSTNCSATPGRYAGCMTAPCTKNEDGLTTCACPIYDGPYQVGQKFDGLECDISPNVWSAADNLAQN